MTMTQVEDLNLGNVFHNTCPLCESHLPFLLYAKEQHFSTTIATPYFSRSFTYAVQCPACALHVPISNEEFTKLLPVATINHMCDTGAMTKEDGNARIVALEDEAYAHIKQRLTKLHEEIKSLIPFTQSKKDAELNEIISINPADKNPAIHFAAKRELLQRNGNLNIQP